MCLCLIILYKGKKRIKFFVDLRAAFDKVMGEKLWKVLEEKEMNEKIIRRVGKIYEETKAVIRKEEEMTSSFTIEKGVRQACVLSPLLFNMYMYTLFLYLFYVCACVCVCVSHK